jgi:hypothetical protein
VSGLRLRKATAPHQLKLKTGWETSARHESIDILALMKIFLYISLGIAVIIGAVVCWFSFATKVKELKVPPTATRIERLELIYNYLAELQEGADFNGAVLFAERGVPLLANTYGFTDCTGKDKLTTRSSFRLASVSKGREINKPCFLLGAF